MNGHPGGIEHTLWLLDMAELAPGSSVLDMGAGDGEGLHLLRNMGYNAQGIDLYPRSPDVLTMDMLHTDFCDGAFDAVLSQCSFLVSGNVPGAISEAARILKPGGVLMLSDLVQSRPDELLIASGLEIISRIDITNEWKQYYIESIWRGTDCCDIKPKGKCSYFIYICRKAYAAE